MRVRSRHPPDITRIRQPLPLFNAHSSPTRRTSAPLLPLCSSSRHIVQAAGY
ncbi:hypothetical protein P167DRAFT_533327, partial [Morchella conica CCBAS932]